MKSSLQVWINIIPCTRFWQCSDQCIHMKFKLPIMVLNKTAATINCCCAKFFLFRIILIPSKIVVNCVANNIGWNVLYFVNFRGLTLVSRFSFESFNWPKSSSFCFSVSISCFWGLCSVASLKNTSVLLRSLGTLLHFCRLLVVLSDHQHIVFSIYAVRE